MRTFPLDTIEQCLNGDGEARADGYSGRGMYGKTCAAVTFDSLPEAFQFFARLGEYTAGVEMDEDTYEDPSLIMQELVGSAQTDSMGRGIVVYFPRWTFS
jgi:hypothetical protein